MSPRFSRHSAWIQPTEQLAILDADSAETVSRLVQSPGSAHFNNVQVFPRLQSPT